MKFKLEICLLVTTLLLILLSLPCLADDSFIVSLQMQPMSISDNRFYIQEVIDGRIDQSNIGFVMVGAFNKKVAAYLAGDFKNTLQSYFDTSFSPSSDKTPIIIKIAKFEISESTRINGEFSRAEIEMEFFKTSEGKIGKLFETEAFVEKVSFLDVTEYHKDNIRNVFEQCFKSFIDSNWETTEVVWEEKTSVEKVIANQEPKMLSIVIKKTTSGNLYYYGDNQLSYEQLETKLIMVPESIPEIKKAKRYSRFVPFFAFTGGFLIGYPLGEAIGGAEEPSWDLAVTGVIGLFLGNRFMKLTDKHYEKAVEIYNTNIIINIK